jgi:hypothetical protein
MIDIPNPVNYQASFFSILASAVFIFSGCGGTKSSVQSPNPQDKVIEITGKGIHTLYRDCVHHLSIGLSGIESSSWSVKADGAEVVEPIDSEGQFAILPKGRKLDLSIYNQGNLVAERSFSVIQPPLPQVELIINGRPGGHGAPIPKLSRIHVKIKPDQDFASHFPEEAEYFVDKIDVLAQLSLGAPSRINTNNGSGVSSANGVPVRLGTQIIRAKPGTTVFIKLGEVTRKNQKGQRIQVPLPELQRTIGLVVR